MKKVARLGTQIVEPNHAKASHPEHKTPILKGLVVHPEERLQTNRDDKPLDQLGKESQGDVR